MTKLIPKSYYDNQSEAFLYDVQINDYFLFFGKSIADNTTPIDSVDNKSIGIFQNMIYGKSVGINDVIPMIKKNLYVANTIYDRYDSQIDLSNNNFFTIVNQASAYHVFKCLDNANRTPSLYQPSFPDIDPQDQIYITADNYVWKYMYSVPNQVYNKFTTTNYFPVVANTLTQISAQNKKLEVISVDLPGRGYDNYCNGIFRNTDIKVNGDPLVYAIGASPTASIANGFYNFCYLTIKSGTGIGQYAKIQQYVSNSTSKTVTLDRAFKTDLASDSTFEISPGVIIQGDGYQTINAEARAIVNPSGNTIASIQVLNSGLNYNFANAFIQVSSVVGVTANALIRVINSPPGGHGKNPVTELNSSAICISVQFSNTDIDIPQTNIYSQIGLIKNPSFNTTTVNLANTLNTFLINEPLYNIDRILLTNNATVLIAQTGISSSSGDFLLQLSQGELVYLTDGSHTQLGVVNTISNSSFFSLTQNTYFSSSSVNLYKTNVLYASGNVSATSTGSIDVVNFIDTGLTTGNFIIGAYSGAVGVVQTISRSNVNKSSNTFVQMYKYVGTKTAGTFIQNETIYQSPTGLLQDATATGILHSAITNGVNGVTVYATNTRGVFSVGLSVYSVTSGVSMSMSSKYPPELVSLTGDILYVENVTPVTRTTQESENIKLIFEF